MTKTKAFEALLQIKPSEVKSLSEYIGYCKFYFKPKRKDKVKFYESLSELQIDFPIVNRDIRKDKDYKNNGTLKDFPLTWLKNEIIGKTSRKIEFKDDPNVEKTKQISNIYDKPEDLNEYIQKLPKYSFAIWFKFKLEAPYFSKDDDEFYIIQNPVLKETNFKVPMIRGSAWKGALAHTFREIINNAPFENGRRQEKSASFFRIFGAGSDVIKTIEQSWGKDNKKRDFVDKLIELILFELGLEINSDLIREIGELEKQNWDNLYEFIKNKVLKFTENQQKGLPMELRTHKGRAIFYPTYFDTLSLEVINPHDRKKRAGKYPIYYEVVPKKTEGIFQLFYIPFDGILKPEDELKGEVEEDLTNLCEAIEKLQERGIGAKTKLGWGSFKIHDKKVYINGEISIPNGWQRC